MRNVPFDEVVRAIIILIALIAAIVLAFMSNSQVAVGAVLAALGAGVGYLFPGKAPAPSATPVTADTLAAVLTTVRSLGVPPVLPTTPVLSQLSQPSPADAVAPVRPDGQL